MARNGRSFARSNRPLRPMDWNHSYFQAVLTTNLVSAVWVITPDEIEREFTDPTWMRALVYLSARLQTQALPGVSVENTGGQGGANHIGFGLIKWQGVPSPSITEDAASPLGSAGFPNTLPDPVRDGQLDWIYRHIWPVAGFSAGTALLNGTCDLDRQSSAKRRLGNDSGVMGVWSNRTSSSIDIAHSVRFLIKE